MPPSRYQFLNDFELKLPFVSGRDRNKQGLLPGLLLLSLISVLGNFPEHSCFGKCFASGR